MAGIDLPDDELTAWLKREIYHMLDMEDAMRIHTLLWGVPYGPTLTMVYLTGVAGLYLEGD